MRCVVALLGLTGCDLFLLDPPPGGFRKTITITAPDMLRDFPVNIALSADPDLIDHALPDGGDIHFTRDGTELAFELVAYDRGTLDAWVMVDVERPTTTIAIEYGGAAVPHAPSDVWRAGGQLVAWHLGWGGATEFDSTRDGRHLSANGDPAMVEGRSGFARAFDGTSALCLPAASQLDLGTGSFSYSLWVHVASSLGAYDLPFDAGGDPGESGGFNLELGTSTWEAYIHDGTTSMMVPLGDEILGRWVQLAVVVNRPSSVETYIDGQLAGTRPFALVDAVITRKQICVGKGFDPFNGSIDEVRVYDKALRAEWLQAEYENLTRPTQFVTIGDEEEVP